VTASQPAPPAPKRVAVVGGGLAGMAVALALARHGQHVDLFEARRHLGGRAASFLDPKTDRLIDLCQHVSMGCCTNLADFCARTGVADCFDRCRVLHIYPPNGKPVRLCAWRWLPAPAHLLPALLKLDYLTLADRLGIARTLAHLAKTGATDAPPGPSVHDWLRAQGQSSRSIHGFWQVILVSALGESLDRVSLTAARKVFVDGFLAARHGYELMIPAITLRELFAERVATALARCGVHVHSGAAVGRLEGGAAGVIGVRLADGRRHQADHTVLAVPWQHLGGLLPPGVVADTPILTGPARPGQNQNGSPATGPCAAHFSPREAVDTLEPSPITGVHLWFDRPIMELSCAALVGRTSHWVFNRNRPAGRSDEKSDEYYYQVVISASRQLLSWKSADILRRVTAELRDTWTAAHNARLLRGHVVTQRQAVFSPLPGLDRIRPSQRTRLPGLVLCGDWTATGWPATMEGAVRSGYMAAEAVLEDIGSPATVRVPDLPRGIVARLLFGKGGDAVGRGAPAPARGWPKP